MFKKYSYQILLTLIICIFITIGILFIQKSINLYQNKDFRTRQSHRKTLPIDRLQGWMTFDYINRNFNIPNDYLKKNLIITTIKYPLVTIEEVAGTQGTSTQSFLLQVQQNIANYTIIKN